MVTPKAIERFLERHELVALDTNVFIYLVEDDEDHGRWCEALFEALSRHASLTSTLTLLELLVGPYRQEDTKGAERFYALFSTMPNLKWVPLSLAIADRAAELRARHRLKVPDSIQIATALVEGATGFIGNDRGLARVGQLEFLFPKSA